MRAFEFLDKFDTLNSKTMVIDKGLGSKHVEDMLKVNGNYFNFIKYGWGTSILCDDKLVKEKNEIYNSYNIKSYTGGTLFELANKQNKIDEYFDEIDRLGFTAIEISDGSTVIPEEDRKDLIKKAKEMGYYTLSEIGKKNPEKDHEYSIDKRIEMIQMDIDSGSDMVIIEGRESGKNIGIYDEKGNIKSDDLNKISQKVDQKKIMWEAPNKNQQIELILTIGNEVNIGNVSPDEIISLETLRRGLRGDTLGKV
ncbi:MAG TPA: phosphosulfolactate synthase [Methanosphaera sp.]|nr:phosphosulfolactate synthase [Methanosphaera sp.]HIJ16106.1 phosphosulfolactate synthase [Methanosphaera sp.]